MKDLFYDLPPLQQGTGAMGVVKYKKETTEYLVSTGNVETFCSDFGEPAKYRKYIIFIDKCSVEIYT